MIAAAKEYSTPECVPPPAKRVLIVEDSPELRSLFVRTFKKMQFEVSIACDGQEALDMLSQSLPDIMLLDVNMPRVSGLEVLRYIHEQPKMQHIKIMLVTGNAAVQFSPEVDFADLVLIKPVSPSDLTTFTQRLLS